MRFSEALRSSLEEEWREVNVERRLESEADQLPNDLVTRMFTTSLHTFREQGLVFSLLHSSNT
jgi:hypothetical protein